MKNLTKCTRPNSQYELNFQEKNLVQYTEIWICWFCYTDQSNARTSSFSVKNSSAAFSSCTICDWESSADASTGSSDSDSVLGSVQIGIVEVIEEDGMLSEIDVVKTASWSDVAELGVVTDSAEVGVVTDSAEVGRVTDSSFCSRV